MTTQRLVGVTVMPEYLQSEGVAAVLDRLQHAGFNAVTTSPYGGAARFERSWAISEKPFEWFRKSQ